MLSGSGSSPALHLPGEGRPGAGEGDEDMAAGAAATIGRTVGGVDGRVSNKSYYN